MCVCVSACVCTSYESKIKNKKTACSLLLIMGVYADQPVAAAANTEAVWLPLRKICMRNCQAARERV